MLTSPSRIAVAALCVFVAPPILLARDLVDEAGRRVTVPDFPSRIVCLAPSIVEDVFAIGRGKNVVGVTDYTDYPPEAHQIASVGGLIDPSIEKIVSLRPDLVLATKEINRRETVDNLARFQIPSYVIDPQGLDGIIKAIRDLGGALGCRADAEALANRLVEKRQDVAQIVAGLSRPKVFVLIWDAPLMTAGNKAFITQVISAAGGESATADIPQLWPQISFEEVLRRAPDFVLLVKGSHQEIKIDELRQRAGWDQLKAVRENHIIYVDERFEHSSPLVFDVLKELARQIHPEAFRSR